ncbi:MAG: O-Antigen ligase [Actinomycetota bacterium]|jgi:O-antigen ligase
MALPQLRRQEQLGTLRAQWVDRRGHDSRRRLWATGLLLIALVVADITGVFIGDSGIRYGLVPLALLLVAVARTPLNRITIRKLAASDWFLLLLCAYGLIGSAYGLMFTKPTSPALALFVPMLVGLLHLTTIGSVEEDEARWYLRRLSVVTALYVVVHALSAAGWLERIGGGGADPSQNVAGAVFGHEKTFLVCIALTAAWIRGRPLLFAALTTLFVVAFFAYPAATYAVAGAVSLMTLVGTGVRARRLRRYTMVLLGLLLGVLVAVEVTQAGPSTRSAKSSLSTSYFNAVGKSNNNETRAELWSTAWHEFAHSPIYGTAFTGNTAVKAKLAGKVREVPPHNDFLQMAMGGGVIGAGLLIGWVVSTNVLAIGRYRRLRASGAVRAPALLRVLLVGFNSFFTVGFLNPVMSRFGLSVAVMATYSLLMTIDVPHRGRATGEAQEAPACAAG